MLSSQIKFDGGVKWSILFEGVILQFFTIFFDFLVSEYRKETVKSQVATIFIHAYSTIYDHFDNRY